MPSNRSRRRDDDNEINNRPRTPRRRRTPNTVIVVAIILAVALPLLLGVAGFMIYRLSTSSTELEVKSGAPAPSSTKSPSSENPLETYRKRLIGRWEMDVEANGVRRHLHQEFKSDGTAVMWGFANGQRVETPASWEAVKVENGQLLVRTVVNGITNETYYSFPSDDEFRYTTPNGQEIVAKGAK